MIKQMQMVSAMALMAANTDQGSEADQEIGSELGRKLSVKELGFDKETVLKLVLSDTSKKHFLVRFVGVATGLKPYKIKEGENAGQTAYGLMGTFEGDTGEVAKAGTVLYLPGYAQDMVANALSIGEDVQVRIAFDVYAKYDKDAATSYVFTVHDLLNNKDANVEAVKEQVKGLALPPRTALAALEAPKK